MALTLEDGTARADADSYASVADLRSYADARGITVPTDDSACEALLREAFEYLTFAYRWAGTPVSDDQAGAFPRLDVPSPTGGYYAATAIPAVVKRAQLLLALQAQSGSLLVPTASTNGAVTKESVKVGPIERSTEYKVESATAAVGRFPQVDALLASLAAIETGKGFSALRLARS